MITGVVGFARQAEPSLRPKLMASSVNSDFDKLSELQQLCWLRAYQLVFARSACPTKPVQASLGQEFDSRFPGQSELRESRTRDPDGGVQLARRRTNWSPC